MSCMNSCADESKSKRKKFCWENSNLREWLNNDFLNTAFSAEKQNAVLQTEVDNGKDQGYDGFKTDGGNDTQDKVFLLSYAEAWKCFTTDEARRCAPTDYVIMQGITRHCRGANAEG